MSAGPNTGRPRGERGPNSRSPRAKLVAFFQQRPDEELSLGDIQRKCGCSYRAALMTMHRMSLSADYEHVKVLRMTPAARARAEAAAAAAEAPAANEGGEA